MEMAAVTLRTKVCDYSSLSTAVPLALSTTIRAASNRCYPNAVFIYDVIPSRQNCESVHLAAERFVSVSYLLDISRESVYLTIKRHHNGLRHPQW